jgi:hypothetical protein
MRYPPADSPQRSESTEEKRRKARYGGKLDCQARNMSTSLVRSCYNCRATELVETYAQVYGMNLNNVPAIGLSFQMDVVLQIVIGPSCVGRVCSLR